MEAFAATLGPEPRVLRGFRQQLSDWLTAAEVTAGARDAVVLAAHEAVANAIQHVDPPGPVTVTGRIDKTAILIEVTQSGAWVAYQHDDPDERGRGIPLIRAYMTDVEFRRERDHTTVRMRLIRS